MNGYVCFYNGDRVEIYADSSYEAQQKAFRELSARNKRRKIRQYDITVVLAERSSGGK